MFILIFMRFIVNCFQCCFKLLSFRYWLCIQRIFYSSTFWFINITSLHYILFLCNFMALLKRLICPAIASEPTTDMMFLSSTSWLYTLSVSCTINENEMKIWLFLGRHRLPCSCTVRYDGRSGWSNQESTVFCWTEWTCLRTQLQC